MDKLWSLGQTQMTIKGGSVVGVPSVKEKRTARTAWDLGLKEIRKVEPRTIKSSVKQERRKNQRVSKKKKKNKKGERERKAGLVLVLVLLVVV